MISADKTVLVLIDVQEKLFRVMHRQEELLDTLQKLVLGMQVLEVPVIATEQYPQGLGPTLGELSSLITDFSPLAKTSFSCCGDDGFKGRFEALGRKQVVICGIESHVCVYQTAADLVAAGYDVSVVTDAVSSRTPENRQAGIEMMQQSGVLVTTMEAVLFELLRLAEGDRFKQISRIVK